MPSTSSPQVSPCIDMNAYTVVADDSVAPDREPKRRLPALLQGRLFLEVPQDETMDDLGGEAAALEEARPPRALLARRRRSPVLALQDGARRFKLACGRHTLDQMLRHALRLELVADVRRAVLAGKDVRALLREALVGELLLLLQLVEQGLQLPGARRVRRE